LPNIPVVDYLHCEDIDWRNGGYPMVSATFHEFIDHTVTTSGQLQQWLIQRGADWSKTSVCYINIDIVANRKNLDRNLLVRKLLGINKDITTILFVARLTAQKQPLVLLESIERLYQINKNFKCVIIGDGPEKPVLLSQINKSKAKQAIHFLGSLPNEKVMEYMDAADIFFLPSAYEGIALSIFEAMAKELAIVGADVGGQKELVTPDCGYLVPRSSPKQEAEMYAKILAKLISEPGKIKELGKNSRRRVEEHFPLEQMINKMDMILQEAIKNHKSSVANVADQYLVILNRLLHLESLNQQLSEVSNNKINKLLIKYQRQYNLARKSYYKLKGIIAK
jgi:glycosyltransferase involved in cell wall biosynthesis